MKKIAFILISLFAATSAHAQNLKAADPQGIVSKIQSLGYKATLSKDDDGDPYIESATDGSGFGIYFYGCNKGKDCHWITFSDSYTIKKDQYVKLRQVVDEWNVNNNLSTARIEADYIGLTFSVIMNNEGIGPNLFTSNYATWLTELVDFRKAASEALK